jgi:hypothetical protein
LFPYPLAGRCLVVSLDGQGVIHQGNVGQIDGAIFQTFEPAQASENRRK